MKKTFIMAALASLTMVGCAEAPKKESQYAIKSKSDAKRAIIYSEIFNRKYN